MKPKRRLYSRLFRKAAISRNSEVTADGGGRRISRRCAPSRLPARDDTVLADREARRNARRFPLSHVEQGGRACDAAQRALSPSAMQISGAEARRMHRGSAAPVASNANVSKCCISPSSQGPPSGIGKTVKSNDRNKRWRRARST